MFISEVLKQMNHRSIFRFASLIDSIAPVSTLGKATKKIDRFTQILIQEPWNLVLGFSGLKTTIWRKTNPSYTE